MKDKEYIVHPFEPIIDKESEILILGSFPSIISRENDFYYGNIKNRFWKLLGRIYGVDFINLTNMEKKDMLKKLHIAIYDSVYSCKIHASSDASIEDVVYSDIPKLIEGTKIKRIYCNGKKSYELLLKGHPALKDITEVMPSTSPANASFTMDRLYSEWKRIKE